MKKALPLILLCALLLSACASRGTPGVSGKVVEPQAPRALNPS